MADRNWQVFDLAEIKQKLKGKPAEYLEFLNVPAQETAAQTIAVADTKYGLGNSDPAKINLIKLGYDVDSFC